MECLPRIYKAWSLVPSIAYTRCWWYMSMIFEFERWRQEDQKYRSTWLYSKSEATLGYVSFKIKTTTTTNKQPKTPKTRKEIEILPSSW